MAIQSDNIIDMKLPTLYHKSKHGVLYSWNVHTEGAVIHSDTGQVGGQRVHSSKIATPKNEGRANATTAAEQAVLECKAMHKLKLDRKYSITPEKAQEIQAPMPMLAQSFEKRKKKVQYPISFQKKIDGCRSLGIAQDDGNVILLSRGNKLWTEVGHINDELSQILKPGDILDGELVVDGIPFQTLVSWMKRKQPDTARIELHVYDIPSYQGLDGLLWSDRKVLLEKFFNDHPNLKYIKHVTSKTLHNEAEVLIAHDEMVALGYEGGMVRLQDGQYEFGFRSSSLLKVKSFEDTDYKVIGVENGVGKYILCAIWICETEKGQKFRVTPKATQTEKEEMLRNSDNYIGRMLTVSYFGLTDDGLPRFGVGLKFKPEQETD